MDINGFGNKMGGLGVRLGRRISAIASSPPIAKVLTRLIKFGLGYLISGGVVLDGWAPFGLAFAAGMGTSNGAVFGIIGAMIGYFRIMAYANGLKYIAICILIYTVGFVFRGTWLTKHAWFMPISAGVCTAAIGFVFVAQMGFPLAQTVFFATEVMLVCLCTHLFGYHFDSDVERVAAPGALYRAMSLIVCVACTVIPLCRVNIIGQACLGQALAVFFVMVCAYHGGAGVGSVAAAVFSMAAGVSVGAPEYCAIYGFSAVMGGIFAGKGRLIFSVVYVIANAAAVFWVTAGTWTGALYEAFFACVFFMLAGEMLAGYVPKLYTEKVSADSGGRRIRDFTRDRLMRASRAFEELGDMLASALVSGKNPENDENITNVFNRPAQEICRKCKLSGACWEKEYISTKDALNSTVSAMREKGRLEEGDLPIHFTSRCMHTQEFINAANHELVAYKYRRQYRSRIERSRKLICRQYHEMAQVFDRMGKQVENQPKFDLRGEERIRRLLTQQGIGCDVCVYRDGANHVHMELEGAGCAAMQEDMREYLQAFSDALGAQMVEGQSSEGKLVFHQREPLKAAMGNAVHKKRDSDMSGDSGSFFKLPDGKLCVILSDGMGSGKAAARESACAINMLEKFIRAGIDPALSLATVNSALVIKNSRTGGFATLDLLCVDLFCGQAALYKYGSAPTYIKRGRHVRRIVSSSLPVGVNEAAVEKVSFKLHYGDTVVLATDGAADTSDDAWLQELLSEYQVTSARKLAGDIMTNALSRYGKSDDMTVMTVYLEKNV